MDSKILLSRHLTLGISKKSFYQGIVSLVAKTTYHCVMNISKNILSYFSDMLYIKSNIKIFLVIFFAYDKSSTYISKII